MVSLAFVRSPHAHAVIRWVDASAARRLEGVLAVLTAGDLRSVARPLAPRLDGDGFTPTAWPVLADGRTCFCGEAVAAVVATSGWVAADARELVRVEYEPLPASVSIDPAPAADRVLFRRRHRQGDVEGAFAGAPLVLRETFDHARCAPSPLEPRGVLADWDGETLTVWASTQTPSIMLTALAFSLGLPETRVRVIAPDVGGGFGLKTHVFPEDVAVAASARVLGRPVKWVEERRESLAAGSQARAQRMDVEVAAEADGVLRGLRARAVSDGGAYHVYPLTGALEPLGSATILPGPYRTPAYEYEAVTVQTHKPPLGAYRGVGMAMGAFVMERLLDLVAERLGLAMGAVRVLPVDALCAPRGSGTFGSRGAVSMVGSAAAAADRVREKLQALAAHCLEAGPADVALEDGRAWVRGAPHRAVTLGEVARLAYTPPPGGLPPGLSAGLEATVYFDPPGPTFSGAVHVAVVEIDRETGRVRLGRSALVDDCGPVINPLIVEGQIHGAVAQGIGEALLEAVVYGDDGQLLTATLMDYALPKADDVPPFEIVHLETPSPVMPGGVKGMGEGGTIGAPAAIANAVADAVRGLGVRVTRLPIRAESLVRAAVGRERPP